MGKSVKITVKTTTEASETVGFFVEEATGNCPVIFDVKDVDSCGWDYLEEGLKQKYPQDGVEVVGFCSPSALDDVLAKLSGDLDRLKTNFEASGELSIQTQVVEDVDWLKLWQKNFEPIVIGNVCVCPEWLTADDTTQKVVKLNSGIAFGTGYHETTMQCLLLAQQIDLKDKTVIDAGCGSGVLALAAIKLGAKNAVLVDIDSQATQAAEQNAELNNLCDKCEIVCGDLLDKVKGAFDVCFANLTADILIRLSADLPKVLKSGSYAILSGIINSKVGEVEDAFCKVGFEKISQSKKGEWSALLMQKL